MLGKKRRKQVHQKRYRICMDVYMVSVINCTFCRCKNCYIKLPSWRKGCRVVGGFEMINVTNFCSFEMIKTEQLSLYANVSKYAIMIKTYRIPGLIFLCPSMCKRVRCSFSPLFNSARLSFER